MSRGRPRLADPTIPPHIDQTKVPKGAYWSRAGQNWYTIVDDGAKKRRQKIATSDARLSDLHRMLEQVEGIDRTSLAYLCTQYHASDKFKQLAANTQTDYAAQHQTVLSYKMRTGVTLGSVRVAALSVPGIQRLIDKMAIATPAKANHLHRYLRMLFGWGIRRGYCTDNPAKGVEQATERKRRRLPTATTQMGLLAFAQDRAQYKRHSPGAISPYLWIAMELAYLCRLRGIEVLTLTDANEVEDGIQTNRRKGSRDSVVRWSPRLQGAWLAAQAERRRIWAKRGMATPIDATQRPLLVNQKGTPITRSGMNTIWRAFMAKAIKAGIITEDQRIGLHDLKRSGVTDTVGTRADKQQASGHRSAAMMDIYDLSVPGVSTPGDV